MVWMIYCTFGIKCFFQICRNWFIRTMRTVYRFEVLGKLVCYVLLVSRAINPRWDRISDFVDIVPWLSKGNAVFVNQIIVKLITFLLVICRFWFTNGWFIGIVTLFLTLELGSWAWTSKKFPIAIAVNWCPSQLHQFVIPESPLYLRVCPR